MILFACIPSVTKKTKFSQMELTNDFLLLLIIRTGSFAVFFIGYRVKETIFAVP